MANTSKKATQRDPGIEQFEDEKEEKEGGVEPDPTTSEEMKKITAGQSLLTSRVISARASSTSARASTSALSRLDQVTDRRLSRSGVRSANGIVVSVLGTPFLRSILLTDGPLIRLPLALASGGNSPP